MTMQGRPVSNTAATGGPLRICGYVTHAWPKQRGGSEVAMHGILKWLAGQGHDVKVVVKATRGLETDGVLYQRKSAADRREWVSQADIVITQQGATAEAVALCEEFDKPLAVYCHNYLFAEYHPELSYRRHLLIWNTHFAANQNPRWSESSIIVRPPVWFDHWAGTPGEHITQINLSKLKGAELFYKLAGRLRRHRFLGVTGGWDNQLDDLGREWTHANAYTKLAAVAPANMTVWQTQQDARRIYAQTRVLLVPTGNFGRALLGESYGLVAVEAMCSGIPVIATNSPGMAEALDGAGIMIDDPHDLDAWADAVSSLDDPKVYKQRSNEARARARHLDPELELVALEARLRQEIAEWKRRSLRLSSPTDPKSTLSESPTVNESSDTSATSYQDAQSSSPTTDELLSQEPAQSTKASRKRKPKSSSSATLTSSSTEDSSSELSTSLTTAIPA
jgi:hypothetical protein